jgi:hypothetical protein
VVVVVQTGMVLLIKQAKAAAVVEEVQGVAMETALQVQEHTAKEIVVGQIPLAVLTGAVVVVALEVLEVLQQVLVVMV